MNVALLLSKDDYSSKRAIELGSFVKTKFIRSCLDILMCDSKNVE